jgi:creatinine amidohydrolase
MGFPMTASISQATLDKMIGELFASMRRHNFRKFVLINGHGGNDFIPFVRQLQYELDVHVFLIDWWMVGMDRWDEIFTRKDDHAGQFETSTSLELFPKLVEMDKAEPPKVRPFRFEAMTQGWARTSRDFSRMTDWCATANPQGANKEAGRKYLDLVTDRIGAFVAEVAGTPIDEYFPFTPSQD